MIGFSCLSSRVLGKPKPDPKFCIRVDAFADGVAISMDVLNDRCKISASMNVGAVADLMRGCGDRNTGVGHFRFVVGARVVEVVDCGLAKARGQLE